MLLHRKLYTWPGGGLWSAKGTYLISSQRMQTNTQGKLIHILTFISKKIRPSKSLQVFDAMLIFKTMITLQEVIIESRVKLKVQSNVQCGKMQLHRQYFNKRSRRCSFKKLTLYAVSYFNSGHFSQRWYMFRCACETAKVAAVLLKYVWFIIQLFPCF